MISWDLAKRSQIGECFTGFDGRLKGHWLQQGKPFIANKVNAKRRTKRLVPSIDLLMNQASYEQLQLNY